MPAFLSTRESVDDALDELAEHAPPQCEAVAFFATQTSLEMMGEERASTLGQQLAERFQTECVIGCCAEGVIANTREIEEGPGIALLAFEPDGRTRIPIYLEFARTPDGPSVIGWPDAMLERWPNNSTLVLLGDPFSFPADFLLNQLNDERPEASVVGGMASGISVPDETRLFLGRDVYRRGAVGWVVHDGPATTCLVSQGCRPVGERFVVTEAEQNMIHALGGQPALEQLQAVFAQLPAREQQLMQTGLHLGRVVTEYQDQFEMGDFLVRNVLGVDHDTRAIVVGDFIRPGQTVQFHLRDEETASLELQQLLRSCDPDPLPQAALLFSCNGRGSRLFSDPNHDAQQLQNRFAQLPTAGFFAQGELGPVGGKNFLHGFTASLALF